jgi:hypothetical protein
MARMGFSGGGHVVSVGSIAYTYYIQYRYPFIDSAIQRPGRNITYATIDCVTSCLHE